MITSQDVYLALKEVLDPELNINIVDLGLIYEVTVTGEEEHPAVHVLMTLTTPGCPLGGTIVRMIRDATARFPGLNPEKDVTVEIVFDPPWTIDMVSEEAKAELGY